MSLFAELRQRKIFRVAATQAVIARHGNLPRFQVEHAPLGEGT